MLTDSEALGAFRSALKFPTTAGEHYDAAAFAGLHESLRRDFPRLFEVCESIDLGSDALLLRWPGHSSDHPMVLMAHQDVVPVSSGQEWVHPPFGAVVEDGVIWGRGTLDCKGSLVAICVAVERLIESGFVPQHDVWLSFGADEEVSGVQAQAAVDALLQREVTPWLVLDEGGAFAADAFPGISATLAVIGITEKGTVDLDLLARGDGGHASSPKRGGATALLARAITQLERRPAKPRLGEATISMFQALSPVAPAPLRMLLGRVEALTAPFARLLAAAGPEMAAMVRTTRAVTTLSGSPSHNVIAATAIAGLNMRVIPGESVDEAVAEVRKVVGKSIEITVTNASEPSPIAPIDGEAFALLTAVTNGLRPEAQVVPYSMIQATDSRHFHRHWPNVYRFTPFRMSRKQRASLHNVNEHLEVSSWLEAVEWYSALVRSR